MTTRNLTSGSTTLEVTELQGHEAPIAFYVPEPHLLEGPLAIRAHQDAFYRPLLDGPDTLSGVPFVVRRTWPAALDAALAASVVIVDGALWVRCQQPGYRIRRTHKSITLCAELTGAEAVDHVSVFGPNDIEGARKAAALHAADAGDVASFIQIHALAEIVVLQQVSTLTAGAAEVLASLEGDLAVMQLQHGLSEGTATTNQVCELFDKMLKGRPTP